MMLWPYVFVKICVFFLIAEHDAYRTRDSVVSIDTVTGCTMRGLNLGRGRRCFSSPQL